MSTAQAERPRGLTPTASNETPIAVRNRHSVLGDGYLQIQDARTTPATWAARPPSAPIKIWQLWYMLHFARLSRPVAFVAGYNRRCRSHACVMTLSSPGNSTPKRKMSQIGTHNGTFHCDEALGCFLLQQTNRFRNAEIVRSRDQDILKDLDIVIDVGGEYDHSTSSLFDSGAGRRSFLTYALMRLGSRNLSVMGTASLASLQYCVVRDLLLCRN